LFSSEGKRRRGPQYTCRACGKKVGALVLVHEMLSH